MVCVYVSSRQYWASLIPCSEAAALLAESARCAADEVRVELAATARAFDVSARFEHRFGDPAHELMRAAQEYGADLMVVGASARALHFVAGSLGSRLARNRHIPVVVVP
jgi:nucleotide-binding universal stress UspA family protein